MVEQQHHMLSKKGVAAKSGVMIGGISSRHERGLYLCYGVSFPVCMFAHR